jgi:hypothetical protein
MGGPAKNPSKPKLNVTGTVISRSGVTGGTLSPPGLVRALQEKQIRWHHGEAAFVLKYIRTIADLVRRCFFYVFHLWRHR